MKKVFLIVSIFSVAAFFVGTAVFLYQKSTEPTTIYSIDSAFISDIVKKTVATGKINPRKSVEIKSQISGVVETLYVEAGQLVSKGDLLAKIQVIPDMKTLNTAEFLLGKARIRFDNARRELVRKKAMFESGLLSESEYNGYLLEVDLGRETIAEAENNVALIRDGASKNADKVSNLVRATVQGMVLDVPVKEGNFITETNTFREGTSIATIANMQDMVFEGKVDESEVNNVREGMALILTIGALDTESFVAVLEYVSPKGLDDQGAIKFDLRAAIQLNVNDFLRAGYSANADIVLDRREKVLVINEGNLQFDGDVTYVEVEVGPQQFERRDIQVGLSDGINIEIITGLDLSDKIKKL